MCSVFLCTASIGGCPVTSLLSYRCYWCNRAHFWPHPPKLPIAEWPTLCSVLENLVLYTQMHYCIFFVPSAGPLGFGWVGPSLCSTVMSTECWAPSLRRWRAVSALWSSPPAMESFPVLWAPPPPPAPPVPLTTQPAAGPVTMATSFILVPAGRALPHPWTTIWTWTWICLMLRFSKLLIYVSNWFKNLCGPNNTVPLIILNIKGNKRTYWYWFLCDWTHISNNNNNRAWKWTTKWQIKCLYGSSTWMLQYCRKKIYNNIISHHLRLIHTKHVKVCTQADDKCTMSVTKTSSVNQNLAMLGTRAGSFKFTDRAQNPF